VDHSRSPFRGAPSEWDLLGVDALLVTEKGGKILLGERFRKEKYSRFGDITLRWRSSMTGEALEAHSLCQYFVYAYVDEGKKALGAWWVLYPTKLLEEIRSDGLKGKECSNPEEGGSVFMAFKPQDLSRLGCIYRSGYGEYRPTDKTKRHELDMPVKTTQGSFWEKLS
jgi:hypothetical protein